MTKKKQIENVEVNEEDDELEKLRKEALETKKSLTKQISEENSLQIHTNHDKPRRFRYDRDTSDEDDDEEEEENNDEQQDRLSLHETNDLNESFDETNQEIEKESPQRNRSQSKTKSKSRSRSKSSSSSDESSPVLPKRLQSVVTRPVNIVNNKPNGSYKDHSRSSKRYRYDNDDDDSDDRYRSRYKRRPNYRH